MYINARVYKSEGAGAGGINATAYNTCLGVTVSGPLDACQAAINRADSVINSGCTSWLIRSRKNFSADNGRRRRNIFVVKYAQADGQGFNMVMRTLHYNQFNPCRGTGSRRWRRPTMPSIRRTAPQHVPRGRAGELETGLPAKDRTGAALVFTTTIADVTSASEGEGARIYKWPIDPKHVAQNNGNGLRLVSASARST